MTSDARDHGAREYGFGRRRDALCDPAAAVSIVAAVNDVHIKANMMKGPASRTPADSLPRTQLTAIRELDWAFPKRPGRGVPPPRSGPPPLGVP
jgi:hypothetical protein